MIPAPQKKAQKSHLIAMIRLAELEFLVVSYRVPRADALWQGAGFEILEAQERSADELTALEEGNWSWNRHYHAARALELSWMLGFFYQQVLAGYLLPSEVRRTMGEIFLEELRRARAGIERDPNAELKTLVKTARRFIAGMREQLGLWVG